MTYAIIKNGEVVNVIVADQAFIDAWLPTSGFDEAIAQDTGKGNIGQKYHDSKFWNVVDGVEEEVL